MYEKMGSVLCPYEPISYSVTRLMRRLCQFQSPSAITRKQGTKILELLHLPSSQQMTVPKQSHLFCSCLVNTVYSHAIHLPFGCQPIEYALKVFFGRVRKRPNRLQKSSLDSSKWPILTYFQLYFDPIYEFGKQNQ